MRASLVIAGVGFLSASAAGAAEPDAAAMLTEYYAAMTAPKPVDARVLERRDELKQKLLECTALWPLPERVPLDVRASAPVDHPWCTIRRIYYQLWPGVYSHGLLFMPKELPEKPAPALLCPHGHWENGNANPIVQTRLLVTAKKGYVVFSPTQHHYEDLALGISHQTLHIWNNMRALDYLESLPEVDKKRIGCAGFSGGGMQTQMLTALDPRVRVAVIGGYTCDSCRIMFPKGSHCACNHFPSYLRFTDHPQIAALALPVPVLYLTMNDWTQRFREDNFPAIKKLYEEHGAAGRVDCFYEPTEHMYGREKRERTYAWTDKWLKGLESSEPEPEHVPLVPVQTLVNLSVAIPEDKGFAGISAFFNMTRQQKSACTREALEDLLGEKLVMARAATGRQRQESERIDGFVFTSLRFPSEGPIRVPALVMRPEKVERKLPVTISCSFGTIAAWPGREAMRRFVQEGNLLVWPEPRFFGVLTGGLTEKNGIGRWDRNAIVWGRPLPAMTATDLRAVIDGVLALPEADPERVTLVCKGSGELACGGLFAAVLDARIRAVDLDFDNCCFEKRNLPAVPFILWHGDVVRWVALLANRKVTLRNLPGEAGDTQWLAARFREGGGTLEIVPPRQARGTDTGATWPCLAHDAARSGCAPATLRPPFERAWYRMFGEEGLAAGVQPIVAEKKVLIGTMAGGLHALDMDTGATLWKFKAEGPITCSVATAGGKVFVGTIDGALHAVKLSDGSSAWSARLGSAVRSSPLIAEDTVIVATVEGKVRALSIADGVDVWLRQQVKGTWVPDAKPVCGPVLSSSAYDADTRRVYVASEDMHVYAFDAASGETVWTSPKLPGVTFRGYYPVIAPDGSVMVTTAPGVSLDTCGGVLLDMVKEVFGDFASWRHTKAENDKLREANFALMAKPGTYEAQLAYLRERLTEEPAFQTFFVLDPNTGKQKFVTPIVYAESMNGTGAPPIVTADGKVIVKFQALLRSRYEHYSPFLNVGYLDTATGHITPIMDQSRTYGWHDSLLLVHDEQCQLTCAGRVLINTHQDNVNAMDLDTLAGYPEPFCRNIHEPAAGEAVGIWARILRGEELPPGKEWLARGTGVYGGGSVIDMPVAVAGDMFFYVPAHEINCGAAVIAYRMKKDGTARKEEKPPAAVLTDEEWKRVQEMPWDWDMLGMPRLDHVLKALPGPVPGTRQQPLWEEARAKVAAITDAELDRYVWEARTCAPRARDTGADRELRRAIGELIGTTWRPLVFPAGKHPEEAYRFFTEPTQTLEVCASAYPYLDEDLRGRVRAYVEGMRAPGGPLNGPTGAARFAPDAGTVRSRYDPPPSALLKLRDDTVKIPLARLYAVWAWAHVTGDWRAVEKDWPHMRELVDAAPNAMEEDFRNGYCAGLIAYCRIAHKVGDAAAVEKGLAKARAALRERLVYELAHTRGGLITQVPVNRSILGRWRNLTPELGRALAAYALPINRRLMDVCIDRLRPTWHLAWNVETMWRNESPFELPTMSAEVFAARALILDETSDALRRYVDVPWCAADLCYVQKLVLCLEAASATVWKDVRA